MVIAEQAKELYKTTLKAYAGSNRIITADEKQTLDKMAEFLSMDSAAVDDIHSEVEEGRAKLTNSTNLAEFDSMCRVFLGSKRVEYIVLCVSCGRETLFIWCFFHAELSLAICTHICTYRTHPAVCRWIFSLPAPPLQSRVLLCFAHVSFEKQILPADSSIVPLFLTKTRLPHSYSFLPFSRPPVPPFFFLYFFAAAVLEHLPEGGGRVDGRHRRRRRTVQGEAGRARRAAGAVPRQRQAHVPGGHPAEDAAFDAAGMYVCMLCTLVCL